jgi:hypothetical protein
MSFYAPPDETAGAFSRQRTQNLIDLRFIIYLHDTSDHDFAQTP